MRMFTFSEGIAMIRRMIGIGGKHGTPTYYVNEIPLDCLDATIYILLHGYDNQYGHLLRGNNTPYPKKKELNYFIDTVNAGRRLHRNTTKNEIIDAAIEILKKYYPQRLKEITDPIIYWKIKGPYDFNIAIQKAFNKRAALGQFTEDEVRRFEM